MPDRPNRLACRHLCAALAVTAAVSLGCTSPEKKAEPLTKLTPDLQAKLASPAPAATKAAGATPTFDPAATGGTNVTVQNSFGRAKPTDTAPSQYAVKLPPPQLGAQPAAGVPALPGTSYVNSQPPTGRVPASDRPLPPMPPGNPVVQTGGTAPLPTPKMDPPATEPPMTRANYPTLPPEKPPVPVLSTPTDLEPPLPKPEPPPPPSGLPAMGALPPIDAVPVNPVAPPQPVKMAPIPSVTEVPVTGIAPPVKLPPAPPIRPQ